MESSVFNLLPKEIQGKSGKVSVDELKKAKIFAIYFSANWCGSCKMFTPQLIELYKKINEKEKVLEILFVSMDEEEEEFNKYYGEMPWLTVPFQDAEREKLIEEGEVQVIPTLFSFNKDGKRISKNGTAEIRKQGLTAINEWVSKA